MDVIPAKAGIQEFPAVFKPLDPGFRRGDNFTMDTRFRGCDNFL